MANQGEMSGAPSAPTQAPEGGSPAQKRARMGPLPAPVVVAESCDHQGLHRAMSSMKGEMKVLAAFVQELAAKHNLLLDDTEGAIGILEAREEDARKVIL